MSVANSVMLRDPQTQQIPQPMQPNPVAESIKRVIEATAQKMPYTGGTRGGPVINREDYRYAVVVTHKGAGENSEELCCVEGVGSRFLSLHTSHLSEMNAELREKRELFIKEGIIPCCKPVLDRLNEPVEAFRVTWDLEITSRDAQGLPPLTEEEMREREYRLERLLIPVRAAERGQAVREQECRNWCSANIALEMTCPKHREQQITDVAPNFSVQELIARLDEEEQIPTFSHYKEENPELAALYLALARDCAASQDYREALQNYSDAFVHQYSLGDYAEVPQVYERSGEQDKAVLAYLHLALYQFNADCTFEAFQTLRGHCQALAGVSAIIEQLQEEPVVKEQLIIQEWKEMLAKVQQLKAQGDSANAQEVSKQLLAALAPTEALAKLNFIRTSPRLLAERDRIRDLLHKVR